MNSSLPSVLKLEEVMQAGEDALKKKSWREALGYFEIAIDLKPNYVGCWLGKAAALRGANDLISAVEAYRQSVKIDPFNREAWGGLIETLHRLKRYSEVVEVCDSQLRVEPRLDDPLMSKGIALGELRKFKPALECYDEVLSRRPENVAVLLQRGALLFEMERLEDALESFDSALAHEPGSEEAQKKRCLILLRLGRFSDAIKTATDMLMVKEDGYLWMLKGLAHAELREVPQALWALEKAKELDPDLDELEGALTRVRRLHETFLQDREEAKLEQLGVADEEETPPDEGKEMLPPQGVAVVLNHMGYPTEALRIWGEHINRKSPDDWVGLGKALYTGGDKVSAERCLRKAGSIDSGFAYRYFANEARGVESQDIHPTPSNELPLVWREVSTLLQSGRDRESLELLQRVLSEMDGLEMGWNWLGVRHALSGQSTQGKEAFSTSIESDSGYATAWNNLGTVQALTGEMKKASPSFEKALKLDPRHVEALHNLGIVKAQFGQYNEARTLLKRALEIKPRPQTLRALAKLSENCRRWKDAMRYYEELLSMDQKDSLAKKGFLRAEKQVNAKNKRDAERRYKQFLGIKGVGPKRSKALVEAGYSSPNSIMKASIEDLAKLPGFNTSSAEKIIRSVTSQKLKKGRVRKSSGK